MHSLWVAASPALQAVQDHVVLVRRRGFVAGGRPDLVDLNLDAPHNDLYSRAERCGYHLVPAPTTGASDQREQCEASISGDAQRRCGSGGLGTPR
jgi:hypothetical protein